MASTLLRTVTGSATGRRRLTAILAFSVPAGLLVDLVVGLRLRGYPPAKFWIVWPIQALVTRASPRSPPSCNSSSAPPESS
ncbi:hypothetical protein [Streptomyces sp. NPDC054958]